MDNARCTACVEAYRKLLATPVPPPTWVFGAPSIDHRWRRPDCPYQNPRCAFYRFTLEYLWRKGDDVSRAFATRLANMRDILEADIARKEPPARQYEPDPRLPPEAD